MIYFCQRQVFGKYRRIHSYTAMPEASWRLGPCAGSRMDGSVGREICGETGALTVLKRDLQSSTCTESESYWGIRTGITIEGSLIPQ